MRHARWRHCCRIGRIDGLHSPHGEVRRSSGLHTPHGHHLNSLRHHRNSLRHHWNSLRHHGNLRHHRGDSSVGDLRRHFLVVEKTLLLFDEFALVLFELILLGLNLTLKLLVLVLEENGRNIFKKREESDSALLFLATWSCRIWISEEPTLLLRYWNISSAVQIYVISYVHFQIFTVSGWRSNKVTSS